MILRLRSLRASINAMRSPRATQHNPDRYAAMEFAVRLLRNFERR
jgi:hypothetical protein